jgi:hypothetical protein
MRGVDVAGLQDAQRRDKLAAEEVAAIPLIAEGRERLDQRHVAAPLAIGGFHAPDGGDDFLVDAIARLHIVQHAAILRQCRAAIGLALFGHGVFKVFPQRFLELGLVLAAADHLGVIGHVAEGAVQRGVADALRPGRGLEILHPALHARDLGGRRVLVASPFDFLRDLRHAAGAVIADRARGQDHGHGGQTRRQLHWKTHRCPLLSDFAPA